ncbi:hypothetical protein MGN70_010147 [Eutypa lata]|nr:hypothetical protein MGN70_010147 [Eutypa lata]
MPSMLATACQNAVLKGAANLTAQVTANWHATDYVPIDRQRILEFAIYGFVGANINYVWQEFLEKTFPGRRVEQKRRHFRPAPVGDKDDGGKSEQHHHHHVIPMTTLPLPPPSSSPSASHHHGPASAPTNDGGISWFNTLAKLVADMTLGLSFMICILLVITNIARVQQFGEILDIIQQKLWQLMKAGWHIWPVVAFISFVWIPVRWRVLVGGCVGFGWNIFLSIVAVSTRPISSAQSKPAG